MSEGALSIIVIGGVETGKTNYVTRFWLGLRESHSKIALASLPDQIEDIEADVQRLLSGEFADRTIGEIGAEFVIPFVVRDSTIAGELIVPDFSGDEWERAFRFRKWSSTWDQYLDTCVGCLVFLRSNVISDPPNWIEVTDLLIKAHRGEFEGFGDLSQEGAELEYPTQTQIVDWLQFLHHAVEDRQGVPKTLRAGIVVAGWDELEQEVAIHGPNKYIQMNLPLLYQFLATNKKTFDYRVFGSSIVGGDLKHDQEFREKYLEGDPIKSGYIISDEGSSSQVSTDFSLPVLWILGQPGARDP